MTHTYDLRNRWSATITAFMQFSIDELEAHNFNADALDRFCKFVRANDYVFTDADLRAMADESWVPLIRTWMSRVPEFRVVTPTWGDPEAITIAIL